MPNRNLQVNREIQQFLDESKSRRTKRDLVSVLSSLAQVEPGQFPTLEADAVRLAGELDIAGAQPPAIASSVANSIAQARTQRRSVEQQAEANALFAGAVNPSIEQEQGPLRPGEARPNTFRSVQPIGTVPVGALTRNPAVAQRAAEVRAANLEKQALLAAENIDAMGEIEGERVKGILGLVARVLESKIGAQQSGGELGQKPIDIQEVIQEIMIGLQGGTKPSNIDETLGVGESANPARRVKEDLSVEEVDADLTPAERKKLAEVRTRKKRK